MVTTPNHYDTTLSIAERVAHLMALMTIEEKVAQLQGVWTSSLINKQQQFDIEKAMVALKHGAGHISRIGAVSMLPPRESAELANVIQKYLVEETRLGIPAIVHEESCAGYTAKDATTFPQAIGQAATWMPELIQEMANVIRRELRSVGAHHALAPVLDIARDPRWGRLEETYGEDPFLISQLGAAYIKGLQGDLESGIVATAKHFVGYGLPQAGMNWAPSYIPERELREVYITPFAAVIELANVRSVMNGYQEIDGIPCGSSPYLLRDILRGELGFDGVVVADYFTLDMFIEYHKLTDNKEDAAVYGLEAGIDIELPAADVYAQPLLNAVNSGRIPIDLIDESVARILQMKFQLGLFDNPYVDGDEVITVYSDVASSRLSRTVAEKSIVLLKNDANILPLTPDVQRIAIIGESADSARLMQGDYHYPSHLEGIADLSGSIDAPAPGEQQPEQIDWQAELPLSTTILQGIKSVVSPETQVMYTKGCEIAGDDTSGFSKAESIARQADVALVVVGDRSGLGLDATTGEAIDRATLGLTGVQQQLVELIYATGTPTIVVLTNGRPPAIPWIAEHIPAVLQAWLPAQEGGSAVADVLFGNVNPAGRLPMTMPRSVGQVPMYYNHKPSGNRSHWHGEYIDESAKPLWAFGYGLSYTQFEYSNLQLSSTETSASDTIQISCNVSNVGQCAGEEVVQLYVSDPIASVTRPVKQLKGFKRIPLAVDETVNVTFELDVRHLGFYGRDMKYIVEEGVLGIHIGSASDDIRLSTDVTITETAEVKAVYQTPVIVSDVK